MRLALILGISAAFFFALHAGISIAQTGSTGFKSPKSEKACYKCCRRNQIKMGLPADQVELCLPRCMVGTARNC